MFKKTRNRILLLNMVMTSTVAAMAFLLIFFSAYNRENAEIKSKMSFNSVSIVSVYVDPLDFGDSAYVAESDSVPRINGFRRGISPHEGVSFSLLIDSDGELIEYNSMLGLPREAYITAAKEVVSNADAGVSNPLFLEGRVWQYATTPITMEFIDTQADGAAVLVSDEFSSINFLDVTDSRAMLRSLGLTLSLLFIGSVTVFFFISLRFANRAIAPLSEAWVKQTRFITDASHELKTPLSLIQASCGALCAESESDAVSRQRWTDYITSGADRMTSLIDDMLSLSYMEDSTQRLSRVSFDLSETVSSAARECQAAALPRNISVMTRIEPGITCVGDIPSVNTVLRALTDNAVKYTPEDGVISITMKSSKKHAEITVQNTGEGIPKEDQPKVFDRFYRGDPSRSSGSGGVGLGLAIAKAASDSLGAELEVKSESGEYAEFIFTLPL